MPSYSGKFRYLDARGGLLREGACQLHFDDTTCTITPASGASLAFDLGDVERPAPGEWDLGLALHTGNTVELRQFGAAFSGMASELTAAWRDRCVRCLLLEDLEESARFDAWAGPAEGMAPAQVRLYRSNLAVLPAAGAAFHWRLADVDDVVFDEAAYNITLCSGGERLVIGKLAKKTGEFLEKLRGCVDELRRHSAERLHELFPFLDPDRLGRLLQLVREGRTAPMAALAGIDRKLPEAWIAHAVSERLRPYFDELQSLCVPGSLMTGYKFIRPDEEAQSAEDTGEAQGEEGAPVFFWFFFPIASPNGTVKLVAWEAGTGAGRATYFFRAAQPVDAAAARLTRGLAQVNFRREPVYLPEESLEREARYRRYAIGCRKLADLRALRGAFLGRAVHSSPEKWRAQVQSILETEAS